MHSDLSDKEFRLIAIDPGTSKLGYAVMDSKGQILEKGIIRDKSNFRSEIEMLTRKYEPEKFILGDGTGSENIKKFLVELSAGKIEIRVVDERSSTETAKKQYFSSFSPMVRLFFYIKYILGIVSIEADDDVAVILAKRYLEID